MTADLGTLPVTGQRRSTPAAPFPTTTGTRGPTQNDRPEDPDAGGGGGRTPINAQTEEDKQCKNQRNKRIWNADAATNAAIQSFLNSAVNEGDGATLSNREFGVNLVLGPNDSVAVAPDVGIGGLKTPNSTPNVTIPVGGATSGTWMGDVHSHPSGDGRPSPNEFADFVARVNALIAAHPERTELANVSMYITIEIPGNPPSYQTYAYTKDSNPNVLGKEVNPQAKPCP